MENRKNKWQILAMNYLMCQCYTICLSLRKETIDIEWQATMSKTRKGVEKHKYTHTCKRNKRHDMTTKIGKMFHI